VTELKTPKRSEEPRLGLRPLEPKPGVELFFGLVSPSGSRVELVIDSLRKHLASVGYETEEIHISQLIDQTTGSRAKEMPFDERVDWLMTKGTELRQDNTPDVCARMAIAAVRRIRRGRNEGNPQHQRPESVDLKNVAYIFRSLKTSEEVETLRVIYGQAFNLISIYSSEDDRRENLAKRISNSKNDTDYRLYESTAQELIYRDSEENIESGQDVKNTFPLADLFVALDNNEPTALDRSIERFVRLLFGDPFITPTKDEYGMFMAKAVAMRSADLGRQVGASILSCDGDLISAGCNEVPKFGGGQYWEGDKPDNRDFQLGSDASVEHRNAAIAELIKRFRDVGWLSPSAATRKPEELALQMIDGESRIAFQGAQILGILEYGRSVHAEMAAITDAAKRGVPIIGGTVYTTTFPCHLCARHIVSAGIIRVAYIEPYAKSKAHDLYKDSIVVNPAQGIARKVRFEPFVGLSPNRYLYFFQPNTNRKTRAGKALVWDKQAIKATRLKRYVASYVLMEEEVVKDLSNIAVKGEQAWTTRRSRESGTSRKKLRSRKSHTKKDQLG
jgi:deoxycytidylate deaminase